MNSTVTNAFINALLADATYALDSATPNGRTGAALTQDLSARMTPTLANYIEHALRTNDYRI